MTRFNSATNDTEKTDKTDKMESVLSVPTVLSVVDFNSMLEALPSGIVVVDPAGKIVTVNGRLLALFGYSRDELVGQPIEILLPERFRAKHVGQRDGFLANPRARMLGVGRELFGRCKDGSEILVEIGLTTLKAKEGVLVLAAVVDVSERKRIEEALRQSQERIQSIVGSSLDAVVTLDEKGKVIEWNPQAEFIFGWRTDEVIGQTLSDLIVPERLREKHNQELQHFLTTGEGPILNHRLELGAVRKHGEEFPIELTISAIRIGGHYEFSAFIRDITERQQAEQNLRHIRDELTLRVQARTTELHAQQRAALNLAQDAEEARKRAAQSEEQLNLALKSSGVGTWNWNIIANLVTWDDYIHPIFGLKPGTFPGTYEAFLALVHPEDQERVQHEVSQTVENDAVYDTEFRVVWPDGSIHVVAVRGRVYRDVALKPVRMTGVCWDLTQRRLTEEERNRLVRIIEATTDFVAMARLDGQAMYVNRAGRKMLGMDDNTPASETNIPDTHPAWANEIVAKEAIPTALREGFWSGETALLRRDGTEVPVSQVVLAHKNVYGEVQYLSTIIRDISDRKCVEEELKRTAQELARSNAELEQFAYIASHDLQEPLRKVQSFGDLLAAKAGPALADEERDYVKRMQAAARRMQELINDLLIFARVTSQARPFVPIDLNRVVQGVLSDLETLIKSCGGRVDVGDLPQLDSDSLQMRQLFQNLIGNALKFHRPDVPPVVVVQARVVKNGAGLALEHSRSDRICEITVCDNGIGFEEKYLDRIFLPFQRLHGRGEYEGTGMGLAICHKIVERHGGTLTARSTPGRGATFTVRLPLSQT